MLIVTGSITARADAFEPLLEAAQAHVERSRAEPGCSLDVENALQIVFFERWRDMASLEEHFAQPGTRELLAAVRTHAQSAEPVTIYEATRIGRPAQP